MAKFKPSPYQEAVYAFVRDGHESLIVNAVAGSGKTTTIVGSTAHAPKDASIAMLAFNKSTAVELQGRVPKNVKASTFHSIWFSPLRKFLGINVQVEARKTWKIIDEELGERERALYGSFVNRMVGLGKGMGIGYLIPNTEQSWADLADHHDVSLELGDANEKRAFEICQEILERSNKVATQGIIDFDDMLYLSLIWNVRCWQYDLVYIDEAQDTNQVQIALLKRMIKPGGRLVAVGDPYQAIYGFRGADSEAMARIAEEFGCQELPLSVSYRCSKAVVREARNFVPHLEFFEGAPEGRVDHLAGLPIKAVEPEGMEPVAALTGEDAILCRNTAPLVEQAYSLIRQSLPCRILGREIGTGLVNLIKKMNAKNIDKLAEKLNAFLAREVAKLTSKGREDRAQAVTDKVETLMIFIDNLKETERTIPALVRNIESLFSDNDRGLLTLSTVHKAKGLEWDRVFILGAEKFMPSKWARKAWQKEQEANLMYVAYTRAKQELYFVPAPESKPQ